MVIPTVDPIVELVDCAFSSLDPKRARRLKKQLANENLFPTDSGTRTGWREAERASLAELRERFGESARALVSPLVVAIERGHWVLHVGELEGLGYSGDLYRLRLAVSLAGGLAHAWHKAFLIPWRDSDFKRRVSSLRTAIGALGGEVGLGQACDLAWTHCDVRVRAPTLRRLLVEHFEFEDAEQDRIRLAPTTQLNRVLVSLARHGRPATTDQVLEWSGRTELPTDPAERRAIARVAVRHEPTLYRVGRDHFAHELTLPIPPERRAAIVEAAVGHVAEHPTGLGRDLLLDALRSDGFDDEALTPYLLIELAGRHPLLKTLAAGNRLALRGRRSPEVRSVVAWVNKVVVAADRPVAPDEVFELIPTELGFKFSTVYGQVYGSRELLRLGDGRFAHPSHFGLSAKAVESTVALVRSRLPADGAPRSLKSLLPEVIEIWPPLRRYAGVSRGRLLCAICARSPQLNVISSSLVCRRVKTAPRTLREVVRRSLGERPPMPLAEAVRAVLAQHGALKRSGVYMAIMDMLRYTGLLRYAERADGARVLVLVDDRPLAQ